MTYPHTPGHSGGASKIAADKVKEKAETIREQVERMVREREKHGMTASEALPYFPHAKETSVRPRFAELYMQGILIKTERLRENDAGNVEHVYVHRGFASLFDVQYSAEQRKLDEQARKARQFPKWQPIETAPKDGAMLLLRTDYPETTVIAAWCDEEGAWRNTSLVHYGKDRITHWMPLPPPPKE